MERKADPFCKGRDELEEQGDRPRQERQKGAGVKDEEKIGQDDDRGTLEQRSWPWPFGKGNAGRKLDDFGTFWR